MVVSILFSFTLSLNASASALDVKHTRLEQRWYSFDEVVEKRSKYSMVDISRGYIEYYFEGEEYTPRYPEENLSPREKFYSNHGQVGAYAAADYEAALDKACIDVVSGSLGAFKGSYENSKRADRQHYKRAVVGIRSLTYKGPGYNFKSPSSWSPAGLPKDKRSFLCEVYKIKGEASDVKYIVYAASVATAIFDEIYTAPLPGKTVE